MGIYFLIAVRRITNPQGDNNINLAKTEILVVLLGRERNSKTSKIMEDSLAESVVVATPEKMVMATKEHHQHPNNNVIDDQRPRESLDNGEDRSLPFWEELWQNPLKFSLRDKKASLWRTTTDDVPEQPSAFSTNSLTGEDDTAKKTTTTTGHTFCNPTMPMMMMMNPQGMNDHELMAQHGVASMPMGGDMSKGMIMYVFFFSSDLIVR